ncbi:MAG: DUF6920 family protein [Gemmatimonadales bacterium]
MYSPGRWGRFGSRYQQVPWEGRFRSYHESGDILIPAEGEVGWYSADRWEQVWKVRIVESDYEPNAGG